MMDFLRYLLDRWITVLFFCAGTVLSVTTLSLYSRIHQLLIPFSIMLYASLFGLVALLVALALEYLNRRPFYKEVIARLRNGEELAAASTFTEAKSREQQLFLQLLHSYHEQYMKELSEIEQKRQFYEMFVTRFAHQIKTPLTVIQLLEDELRNLQAESVIQERLLDVARSLGDERARLTNAMNMMLYTARLNAFSFDAHMESVEILSLIRQEINQHKQEWIRYALFPKINCDEEKVMVYTDRKWLSFICEQIIRNALQYGVKVENRSNGNLTTPFVIRIDELEDKVQIDFIDQGIGIPAQDLRHVFEPFYTGTNGRTHSRATGMGLYLVKEVVTHLGHRIHLDSHEGKGTTVSIVIIRPEYHQVAR